MSASNNPYLKNPNYQSWWDRIRNWRERKRFVKMLDTSCTVKDVLQWEHEQGLQS